MPESSQQPDGLFSSVERVGSSLLALLQNRVALFAVELQEEKLRALQTAMWLAIAMALGFGGVFVAIAALALYLWFQAGYAGLIGLALVCLLSAVGLGWWLRQRILTGPTPFAVTAAEFRKDLQCLRPSE